MTHVLMARRHSSAAHTVAAAAAIATLLVALTGCRDRAREAAPRTDTPVATRRLAPMPAPAWRIEGPAADTLLGGALALAADDSSVYVLDHARQRVLALDARTGAARWSAGDDAGRRGPRFMAATAMARTPLGALAVLDGPGRRIHVLGADGRVRESIALAPDEEPSQLCARADGGFVTAGGDAGGRLVALDATGARAFALPLPWADADTLKAVQLQAALASSADGAHCVAALRLGRGFAVLDGGTPPVAGVFGYVERIDLPAVRVAERRDGAQVAVITTLVEAPAAAGAAAVVGGTVVVAFEGATDRRARLVDMYALQDGRYAGSLLHDTPVVAIAGWGSRLYVLHRRHGRFALSAHDVPALHGTGPESALLAARAAAGVDARAGARGGRR